MDFTWVLLGLVVVVLFIVFKFKHLHHEFQMYFIGALILFAVGSVLIVYRSHSVDLTTFEGFLSLGKFYVLWLKQLGHNVVDVTGYVIHQEWTLNATNISK
ncbi:MAG TPA: hypothetical protein VHA12_02040 [Candidatus Nanoarchaeia archaeon]|nr:hypothetical protein [Candidatus Nanoarchaeia archaeon]